MAARTRPSGTGLRDLLREALVRSRRIAPLLFLVATGVATFRAGAAGLALLLPGVLSAFRPGLRQTPTYAIGLPGAADGPPPKSKVPAQLYAVVGIAGGAAALVLAVLSTSAVWLLSLAAFLLVVYGVAAEALFRYLTGNLRLERTLRAYAPTIGMAYAGRSGGPWQLRMWEPYLLRSGERCIIINLHEKYLAKILGAQPPLRSPVVQLGSRGSRHLRRIFVPSLRTLYYVQNAGTNAKFMKYRRITHVWLNHGDSDKPAAFHPRHATYDRLVVSGRAGIERYARHGVTVSPEKFVIVGRPQASAILPAGGPIARQVPKTVLYAPTWNGLRPEVDFSSLPRGRAIVQALIARDVTVVFRPHPLSYNTKKHRSQVRAIHRLLAADSRRSGRAHVWGEQADKTWSVADCANHADALVSDVSSVVSDFLQSEKPFAMTSMQGASVEQFRAENLVARAAYVLLGDLSNLDTVLDDLLDVDPLAETRADIKRHVLGDFTGEQSADAFATFVRELAGSPRMASKTWSAPPVTARS